MKDKVLSVAQCLELVDMGIDMSDAVMCWHHYTKPDGTDGYSLGHFRYYHREDYVNKDPWVKYVPTYTLHDILEKLPKLDHYYYPSMWQISKNEYQIIYKPKLGNLEWIGVFGTSFLDVAFKMLKHCKQNNLI